MKTDSIFYQLFQTLPGCLFDLLNLPSDIVNDYQLSSVEVKQLAFRIDGVFLPKNLLQLIETILVYKLPQMNRQEIEKMFSLSDLRETKVYQEALEQGREQGRQQGELAAKIDSIPRWIALGLSVEQIAQGLDLEIEEVVKVVNKQ
ncbi:conserved hypothetical protein [Rippkaea orientalis PCC 8801]|uniref:Rpn family recombination-promoting nuclease/putative transposase n=1 Tax=Rippkaea orientalis (strain PCC 8801 / RF-1) TaxID=41431 RepID=B7JUZ5_RIPO1|nr:Rpn family recombination-promoting nuclease/putative transposase [Rippkaea orientalis]ACK66847.1 conserved hypothetical protein [Rippkaea orientalis PCC 8801]